MSESNYSATNSTGATEKNRHFKIKKKDSRFCLLYKRPKPDEQNVLYIHQQEIFEGNGVLYDIEKDPFGSYPIS